MIVWIPLHRQSTINHLVMMEDGRIIGIDHWGKFLEGDWSYQSTEQFVAAGLLIQKDLPKELALKTMNNIVICKE